MARSFWKLAALIVEATYGALITGILRYGLTLVGSRLPDGLLDKLDTQVINITSRRIAGLPVNTRLRAVHLIADTYCIRNPYLRRCAFFLRNAIAA